MLVYSLFFWQYCRSGNGNIFRFRIRIRFLPKIVIKVYLTFKMSLPVHEMFLKKGFLKFLKDYV